MRNSLILLSLILLAPFIIQAQSLDSQGGADSVILAGITITITPSTPGPNQRATARLESSTINLDSSNITWSVNGKVIQSGRGLKSINFNTGDIGSESRVSASIDTGGGIFNQISIIEIGSIDLMWQGIVYTPPFYKGRALWSNQSGVRLLAVPHVSGNPNNVVYRWSVDGKVLGNSSGVGKNTMTTVDSILGLSKIVKVEALGGDGLVLAVSSVKLTPIRPRILIYEDNPLYGLLLNREASSNLALNAKEISFEAMPLFFSSPIRNSTSFSYSWNINGKSTSEAGSGITFRTPEGVSGQSEVGVSIDNIDRIMQSARKSFTVQFGKEANI
jgi:hypothetical protein